jgi:hypothetical protein
LEIALHILELLFGEPQIIGVEFVFPNTEDPEVSEPDPSRTIGHRTKIFLDPPPLRRFESVCRLFRHMYRKTRPTLWGSQFDSGVDYNVDLSRDIFHVRLFPGVKYQDWDPGHGSPHDDPLANKLVGIQRLATSPNYVSPWRNPDGINFLRHVHPTAPEILVLVPVSDLKKELKTDELLTPLGSHAPLLNLESMETPPGSDDEDEFREETGYEYGTDVPRHLRWTPWWRYREELLDQLRWARDMFQGRAATPEEEALWVNSWRLAPVPKVTGYLVDSLDLRDDCAQPLYDVTDDDMECRKAWETEFDPSEWEQPYKDHQELFSLRRTPEIP